MNKTRVSYETYPGSGIQHLTQTVAHSESGVGKCLRHFLQRLKISNCSAQRASALAHRRRPIQGLSGIQVESNHVNPIQS